MSKYSVLNSDYYVNNAHYKLLSTEENTIRLGIIREVYVDKTKRTKYTVEVHKNSRTYGMACVLMTRFGGIHNYEEYSVRPWTTKAVSAGEKGTGDASLRSGDTVVVACLNGTAREGIILGGYGHPGRPEKLQEQGIAYASAFQGLETSITDEGNYRVTYNGKPINTEKLDALNAGKEQPEPSYESSTSGSYFEFDEKGSYTIADLNGQIIKMKKQTGNIVIVSGDRRIEIGAADTFGLNVEGINLFSDHISMTADVEINVYVDLNFNLTADTVSIGAAKVAIGNSDWELFDQLGILIDTLAELTLIDSQGGPTLAFMLSPEWAKIKEWKTKMENGIKGTITDVEPLTKSEKEEEAKN